MRVLIHQFLGKNHSWSVVGWNIARQLIAKGHEVDLFSTDGIKHLPKDLLPYVKGYIEENDAAAYPEASSKLSNDYDCQISYTGMKNFPRHLSRGTKNRFGIWCYEWAGKNALPTGFAKHYKSCDKILAPSQFAKQVFLDSGVPNSSVDVIPHGVDFDAYKNAKTIDLPTSKKIKILANLAQPHLRKNFKGLLTAFGKAFSNKDDVCLIIKSANKDLNPQDNLALQIREFNKQFPKHAEVIVQDAFIENIEDLYKSIDIVFTMSRAECFYFPALEGIAAGKINIAPNYGGQLDFLNDDNALLISGRSCQADPKSMYWEQKLGTTWFEPNMDDAVFKLRYAYENCEVLTDKFSKTYKDIESQYSWSNIVDMILEKCT